MAEDRISQALRPSKKEVDAQRIEIECVEPPGESKSEDGYIVTVYPRTKENKPGATTKGMCSYTNPIKRVFESEDAVLAYLKKVL